MAVHRVYLYKFSTLQVHILGARRAIMQVYTYKTLHFDFWRAELDYKKKKNEPEEPAMKATGLLVVCALIKLEEYYYDNENPCR